MHTDNKKKIAMVVQRYGLEVNGGAELECRLYAERLTPFYDVTILTTCAVDHYTWADSYKPGEEIRPEHYRAVAAAIRFAEAMRQRARQRGTNAGDRT